MRSPTDEICIGLKIYFPHACYVSHLLDLITLTPFDKEYEL
jgi:hypothetical protein